MQEYLELKQFLLKRTQRFGTFLTVYVFLVAAGKAALCAGIGATAAYVYTAWLCRDIDNVTGDDDVPMRRAAALRNPLQRRLAKASAGLRQQAQPRLLVRRT